MEFDELEFHELELDQVEFDELEFHELEPDQVEVDGLDEASGGTLVGPLFGAVKIPAKGLSVSTRFGGDVRGP